MGTMGMPGGGGTGSGSPMGGPSAAPGGAATTSPGGAATPQIVSRDSWTPLSSFMKSGALAGGQPSFNPGAAERNKPAASGNHTRTEFVVVFFWKEPTPSDILRGEDPNAKPPPPTQQAPAQPSQPSQSQPPPSTAAGGEDKPATVRGGLSDLGGP
jgi:hypothetical protein